MMEPTMTNEQNKHWVGFLRAERQFNEEAAFELGYALAKQLTGAYELAGDYGALRLTQERVDKIDKALRPLLERQMAKHEREIQKIDKQLAHLESQA